MGPVVVVVVVVVVVLLLFKTFTQYLKVVAAKEARYWERNVGKWLAQVKTFFGVGSQGSNPE